METTDAKGSLHSSYVVVNSLEHRSIVSNLVVAIHQSPTGQKHRHQQPVDELPTSDDGVLADSNDKDDVEDDDEDDDDDIKAQIYVDCQFVGTISLASSFKHMIQQSPTGALHAVNETLFTLFTFGISQME